MCVCVCVGGGGGGNGEWKSEPKLELRVRRWYERAWYTAEANRVGEEHFLPPSLFSRREYDILSGESFGIAGYCSTALKK